MEFLKGIYHADKLEEQAFVDQFTIRQNEFRLIMETLNRQTQKPLQHFLITGKRGMGKSTLLRRIHIEACKPPLKAKMFSVRLGAEQYRLSRLFKLWEQVIEALGQQEPKLMEQKKILESGKNYEEALVQVIIDHLADTGKTLLLLIDNFDHFIEKIPLKDQHTLREILMQYPMQIIGNSVFYNEHFKSYNQPFYDFFKPIKLANLNKEEAEFFIRLRAAAEGVENFEELFKKDYGKIQALRILSGGVPRTLLILLSIILKKNTGDAVDYLEEMMEQVTPLYQDRMKALSPQQQELMHHLAMHWDRTPVKDLAGEMRIPSKSISAQLVQLESMGYINKIDIPGRNHYYEIDERFFNIWLLMSEAPAYDTKRVIWLTKWLDAFYSHEEIKDFAFYCKDGLKNEKAGSRFLLAQALSESEKLDDRFKKQLVSETARDLVNEISDVKIWAENFDKKLSVKGEKLFNEAKNYFFKEEYERAIILLDQLEAINNVLAFCLKGDTYMKMKEYALAEQYLILAAKKGNAGAMNYLAVFYEDVRQEYKKAEKYYRMAVEGGSLDALYNFALFYEVKINDYSKAEKYYLRAIDNDDTGAMYNLALLYYEIRQDYANAEKYYQKAVEKGHVEAMFNLANFYENQKKDFANAEKYYLLAAVAGDGQAMNNLAVIYEDKRKDNMAAEKYYLLAVEKGVTNAMNNLANLYFHENRSDKKQQALNLIQRALAEDNTTPTQVLLTGIIINLWAAEVNAAKELLLQLLNAQTDDENITIRKYYGLAHFIIFKQKELLYQVFSENQELKDQFKPVYFALMHEMKEEHPKEYLKMTEELQEPVNGILDFVKKEKERLGLL